MFGFIKIKDGFEAVREAEFGDFHEMEVHIDYLLRYNKDQELTPDIKRLNELMKRTKIVYSRRYY